MSPEEEQALLWRLFTEIGIIDQLVSAQITPLLPGGMTIAQFRVLNHFVRLGGQWSPARLARAFQQTRQTMTTTLSRMEAAGLVCSVPSPDDGRAKLVTLTDRGRAMHARSLERLAPHMARLGAILPMDQMGGLCAALGQMRERLDRERG